MKKLVPINTYGLFADIQGTVKVNSLFVAKFFDKRHDNVLTDIKNLDCSKEFGLLNFKETSYKDDWNRNQKCYEMTRDGFMFLAMGYRGAKAAQIKELYIKHFNEMEEYIKTLQTTTKEFALLSDNIKLIHDNPKPYHYSNESDMINRLALGMSARKFREANGIPKGGSIRPYLTKEQIELIDKLQKVDVGLLVAIPDYEQRKICLEWYMQQQMERN